MRVVAGTAKGRRLVAPTGGATRPTADRVREATFNALASLGAVDGAVVLDLFAGSGAMGVEALSRGAASATFVDRDRRALEAVRTNVAAAGFADRADIVRAEASSFLGTRSLHVDLAVLDPPYALDDEGWTALLAALDAEVVVCESDRALDGGEHFEVLRVGRYGTTVVTLAAHR